MAKLINGKRNSCGCLSRECLGLRTTHGLVKHPLYKVWEGVKQRCLSPNRHEYKEYGGRGITLYKEWEQDFKTFFDWATANGWKEGLSIDREDVDGHYEPSNCRFVDNTISGQNTRLISKRNKSGFRGVCSVRGGKWEANLRCDNVAYHLGYYKTPEEAAHVRDAKVKELGSEHPLNFPDL